jgi:hypothetical protein
VGSAVLAGVLVIVSVAPAGGARPARDVSTANLEIADYSGAVLTPKDIKRFAATTADDSEIRFVTPGAWQPRLCDAPVTQSGGAVAGRTVVYSPSDEASLSNAIVAFPTTRAAKAWMLAARAASAGCDAPYQLNTTTFTPAEAPKVPEHGDQQMALAGTLRFPSGRQASSLQLAYRHGQLVEYAQMLSFAALTPEIVSSVAGAMDHRLDRAVAATARAKPVRTKAGKIDECGELLSRTEVERQFSVPLQDDAECSYSLAEGAGSIDVDFTGVADGGRRLFPRLAQGRPVDVDGASEALFRRTTNQFDQVFETMYVLTDRGDYFSIAVRGDDAPKDQRANLVAAAEAAVKASSA